MSLLASAVSGIVPWAADLAQAPEREHAARLENQRRNRAAAADLAYQREFAQHGLRWKVEDGRSVGLSPLASIGGVGAQYSPVMQTAHESTTSTAGDSLSRMGQNISRAVGATQTEDERLLRKMQVTSARLDIEGKSIDNAIRATQLNHMGSGPGFPPSNSNSFMPGQGGVPGRINDKPMERVMSAPGAPYSEPGASPDVGWAYTKGGGLAPVPSKDIKERIEDNFFQEAAHFFRNNIIPSMNWSRSKPPVPAPAGHEWEWNGVEYFPVRKHWAREYLR